MLALFFVPKEKSRVMWYLWVVILLVFALCSIEFIGFLHKYLPSWIHYGHFSVISGLVITPLLGLAAWSLDEILNKPMPVIYARDVSPEAIPRRFPLNGCSGW